MVIRRARPEEEDEVRALAQAVVDETYGGLWSAPPVPIGDAEWWRSWVAVAEGGLVGMVLTDQDWGEDLWLRSDFRRRGFGRALLARGEAEIVSRGYRSCRLRVVRSNAPAIAFYRRCGWKAGQEVAHETLPIVMLEMVKEQGRPEATAPPAPGRRG